jgi:hypothetical protein
MRLPTEPATTTEPLAAAAVANDLVKAQWIRVADVVLVGPLMIVGAVALSRRHPLLGLALGLLGAGTIALNGVNYLRIRNSLVVHDPMSHA